MAKSSDQEELLERFEYIKGAVKFAMDEVAHQPLEAGPKMAYGLSMFICAIKGTDTIAKETLTAAIRSVQEQGFYQHEGFLFRAANLPTGPRCWVELIEGVPPVVAERYRKAIDSDETMQALARQIGTFVEDAKATNRAVEPKAKHVARRIAYWLQSRPEFNGIPLKSLEILPFAIAMGVLQTLEPLPREQLLQTVPLPPEET